MQAGFLQIDNGEAVPRDRVPHLDFDELSTPGHGDRWQRRQGGAVFRLPGRDTQAAGRVACRHSAGGRLRCPEAFPSMAAECEPFHMFEREIAEQYGVRPEGHPWLKMVRYHPNYGDKPDVFGNDYSEDIPDATITMP
jgi:hypothetical protein